MSEPTLYPPDTCPFREQARDEWDDVYDRAPASVREAIESAGVEDVVMDAWVEARAAELMHEAEEHRMAMEEP